jgi:hypothetical protein
MHKANITEKGSLFPKFVTWFDCRVYCLYWSTLLTFENPHSKTEDSPLRDDMKRKQPEPHVVIRKETIALNTDKE